MEDLRAIRSPARCDRDSITSVSWSGRKPVLRCAFPNRAGRLGEGGSLAIKESQGTRRRVGGSGGQAAEWCWIGWDEEFDEGLGRLALRQGNDQAFRAGRTRAVTRAIPRV